MKQLLFVLLLSLTLIVKSQDIDNSAELQRTEIGLATPDSYENMRAKLHPVFVKLKGEKSETLYDEVTYYKRSVILTNFYAISTDSKDLKIIQVDRVVKRNKLVRGRKFKKEKSYSPYETP